MLNKDKVGIQVRVPEPLREALHRAAAAEGTSLNDFMTTILAAEVHYDLDDPDEYDDD